MLCREDIRTTLDVVLQRETSKILADVPYADHLIDDNQGLDEKYYLRHLVETIKRIRMSSQTDALALARMIDEDYEAARMWGQYTAQEMTHDLLFMKDLRQHGYTDEQVTAIEPFKATKAMIEYLKTKIDIIGSLPAVAYSLFVEWNSERSSVHVINKAEKRYSQSFVSGAKIHVRIDEHEDHYGMMLDIVYRLLLRYGNEETLIDVIGDIAKFVGFYFCELYESTIAQDEILLAASHKLIQKADGVIIKPAHFL